MILGLSLGLGLARVRADMELDSIQALSSPHVFKENFWGVIISDNVQLELYVRCSEGCLS